MSCMLLKSYSLEKGVCNNELFFKKVFFIFTINHSGEDLQNKSVKCQKEVLKLFQLLFAMCT